MNADKVQERENGARPGLERLVLYMYLLEWTQLIQSDH